MNEQLDKPPPEQEPVPLDLGLSSLLNNGVQEKKVSPQCQVVELDRTAAVAGESRQLSGESAVVCRTGVPPRRSAFELLAEEGLWDKLGLLCERRVMASGQGDIEAQVWWIKAQLALGAVPVAALTAPLDEISKQLIEVLGGAEEGPSESARMSLVGELSVAALRHLVASALVEVADTLEKNGCNSLKSDGLENLVVEFRDRALVLFGDTASTLGFGAVLDGPESGGEPDKSGFRVEGGVASAGESFLGENTALHRVSDEVAAITGQGANFDSGISRLSPAHQVSSTGGKSASLAHKVVPLTALNRGSLDDRWSWDTATASAVATSGSTGLRADAWNHSLRVKVNDPRVLDRAEGGRLSMLRLTRWQLKPLRLKRRTAKRIARALFVMSVGLCIAFGAILLKPLFTHSSSYAVRLPIQLKTRPPDFQLPDGERPGVLAHLDAVFYDLEEEQKSHGSGSGGSGLASDKAQVGLKESVARGDPPPMTSLPLEDRQGRAEIRERGSSEHSRARASRSLEKIDTSGPSERELPLDEVTLDEDRRLAHRPEEGWQEPSRSPFSPENFPRAQDYGSVGRDSSGRSSNWRRDRDGGYHEGLRAEAVAEAEFVSPVEYVVIAPTGIVTRPSYVAPIVIMLRKGDTVVATGTLGEWLRVRSRSGQSGFILEQDAVRAKTH